MASEELLTILIQAEDEDAEVFNFECRWPLREPLHKLRKDWARHFGVSEAVVAFQLESEDADLDLVRTPMQLGWVSDSKVHLRSVPAEDDFAEQIVNGTRPSRPDVPVATAEAVSSQASLITQDDSVTAHTPRGSSRSAPLEEPPVEGGELASGFPRSAPVKESPIETVPHLSGASRSAPATEPPEEQVTTARATGSEMSLTAAAKKQKTDTGVPVQSSIPRTAPVLKRKVPLPLPAPTERHKPEAPRKQQKVNKTVCPVDDDAVEFQQTNPKRQGSASYDRYEKYKKARTVKEAMRLGASKGDIPHDFSKGFLKHAGGA